MINAIGIRVGKCGGGSGPVGPDGVPSNLVLTVVSDTEISASFDSSSTNQDGYRVYISTDNIIFTEQTTGVTSPISLTGLIANTLYYVYVVAYKGSIESDASEVESATTFIDLISFSPNVWLVASDLTGVDLSEITAWEDRMENFTFAPAAAEDNPLLRKLSNDFVYADDTKSGLWATLSGAPYNPLTYLDVWIVAFPRYEDAAEANILLAYRSESTRYVQIAMTDDEKIHAQFRTSANVAQNIDNELHVGRFNIIHLVLDKANNIVTFEVDGVEAHLDYTFGVETLAAVRLVLLNTTTATSGITAANSARLFNFAEKIIHFSNGLLTIKSDIYYYLNTKYNLNNYFTNVNKTRAEVVAATPLVTDYIVRQDIYDLVTANTIQLFEIQPTDNPQTIFNSAPIGSLLRFKAGTHTHPTGTNRSILYCSKPMYIEIEAGATLKLADNSNTLDLTGEVVTNQGTAMVLNDFSIRGTYSGTTPKDLCVRIDAAAVPDTFKWGIGTWEPTYTTTGVAITGNWQSLAGTGLEIKFNATTGHALNNLWIVCFDGEECYGIRAGTGFQAGYINNVVIFGDGTIDMNRVNQIDNSSHAKNLPAGVLIHGRCRDTIIEGVTIQNGHRAILAYGDNDGIYGNLGAVTGGENFDCINTVIVNATIRNDFHTATLDGYGILLGHPEHRGGSIGMKVILNDIETYGAAIEPNFRLNNYEIRNNKVRASLEYTGTHYYDIRLWRESMNGIIANNDAEVYPLTSLAPTGWETPKNYYLSNNARI